MALLRPTRDLVFKLYFTPNERLLCSLIESVLRRPIASARIQNASIDVANLTDRGLVLDILVALPDGTRVNVEMQCDKRANTAERWLYHWARVFAKGLERGDDFTDLRPVVCIVLLNKRMRGPFHQHFVLREEQHGTPFSDALAIHLVQLPRSAKPGNEPDPQRLVRWSRFLRARTLAELQSLAEEDPIMAEAKQALEALSADPEVQRLAEAAAARRVFRSEYAKQLEARGEVRGRVATLEAVATALGLTITDARRTRWRKMSARQLDALAVYIAEHRAFPEDR